MGKFSGKKRSALVVDDDRKCKSLEVVKQDNRSDDEQGMHAIHELHLVGILGPGGVCPPRALMRWIISSGYLLDSRIPLHIEIVKLGIGKDSKIVF